MKTTHVKFYRILTFLIWGLAASAILSNAATYTVTTTANAGPGSLRDAIRTANNNPGHDTIQFSRLGVFSTPQTIRLTTGELEITDRLTIVGPGLSSRRVTISGDADNSGTPTAADSGIFDIGPTTGTIFLVEISNLTLTDAENDAAIEIDDTENTTIENCTISNSNSGGIDFFNFPVTFAPTLTIIDSEISDNTTTFGGGGIYLRGVALTMSGTVVTNNTAGGDGGGIYSDETFSATDCVFSNNTAIEGGGLSLGGISTLTDCTIEENVANRIGGGGIDANGDLTIQNTTISGNSATTGGGGIEANGDLTIQNSTISGNSATTGGGGIEADGDLTIQNSTISGNSATTGGGGIDAGGDTTIQNSTISGNTSTSTGGGIHQHASETTLDLVNTTISANTAALNAGGIYAHGPSISATNCTITGNIADSDNDGLGSGGGINLAPGTSLELKNTIVAGNMDTFVAAGNDGPDPDDPDIEDFGSHTIISLGSNLIGVYEGPELVDGVNGDIVGTLASPVDPMLGPLADNGGDTMTHGPLPGSPAIEAGDSGGVLSPPFIAGSPILDQRGSPRIAVTSVDIGAV